MTLQTQKAVAVALTAVLVGAALFGGYYWGYRADPDAAFHFAVRWLMILVLSEILGGWLFRWITPKKRS